MTRFGQKLTGLNYELRKSKIEILQVNLGKFCNLACVHCHVEAGPTKLEENMSRETAEAIVGLLDRWPIRALDLTGGAPELNPNFRTLVQSARDRGIHVMDRCNLTVLFEPGQEDLAQFLARNQVEIIASLPCYLKENVDKQRGQGTFDDSIRALILLNQLGYGKEGSGLVLNLVYNPIGPHLPPDQAELEKDYKERLNADFGIVFNQLYTITNMPITRYAKYLKALGQYDEYVRLLETHFNPATLSGLMCRNTLSVSWDGKFYDCDFNQALGLEIKDLENTEIMTGDHCFGCTAGSGSSCGGAIT